MNEYKFFYKHELWKIKDAGGDEWNILTFESSENYSISLCLFPGLDCTGDELQLVIANGYSISKSIYYE